MRTSDAKGMAAPVEGLQAALRASRGIEYALVDEHGRVLDHNPAFARALGREVERGTRLQGLERPLAERLEEETGRAIAEGRPAAFPWDGGMKEYEVIPLPGRTAVVLGRAAPLSRIVTGEEREELYSKLFLHSQIPMLLIEPASARIVDANYAASRFYGHSRDALVSMSIIDINLLPPDKVRSNMEAAMRGAQRFFFRHRLASGEMRRVEVHSGPIRIAGTDFLYSIVHDITERKRAEEIARQNEERYRALSDASYEGVIIHSDFVILDANRAFAELAGATPSQLMGRDLKELIDPASRALAASKAQEARSGPYELTMVSLDGRRRLVEVRGQQVVFQDRPARVVTVLDVTERKLFETALENERARLRAILDSLPVGVFIADATGGLVESNPMASRIWGGSVDAASVAEYEKFEGFWADTGKRLRPEDWGLARAVSRGEVSVGEVVDIVRFDGGRATILLSAAPVLDPRGGILGGVEISQDITRQKETERQARMDKERAELYLDLLTHDINNLNTVAISYLQMLQLRELTDDEKRLVERPLEALQDSSELIASITAVQRAGEGARRELELGPLLREVRSDVPLPPDREVSIELEGVEGMIIETTGLIRVAFYNLVDNAVKHSSGPVHVWIRGRAADGRAVVTVEDDGPGIPDEVKARLFVRRQRGRTRSSGHGLGLFLVRSLVESHGGTVRLEDRVPGDHAQGARFVIDLPLARPAPGR